MIRSLAALLGLWLLIALAPGAYALVSVSPSSATTNMPGDGMWSGPTVVATGTSTTPVPDSGSGLTSHSVLGRLTDGKPSLLGQAWFYGSLALVYCVLLGVLARWIMRLPPDASRDAQSNAGGDDSGVGRGDSSSAPA